MTELLKALPAIADLGVPVVSIIIVVFLVVFFVKHIEKKDKLIERMDQRRSDDTKEYTKAIDDFRNFLYYRRDDK